MAAFVITLPFSAVSAQALPQLANCEDALKAPAPAAYWPDPSAAWETINLFPNRVEIDDRAGIASIGLYQPRRGGR